MGKKRRGPTLDELLARPWCYYCERDFDDLKILISHQKAKHFKCERCGRRLNTAGGLSVHMSQVHKEQLTEVDNALPNRVGLDVEIFGMEGLPDDVLQAHQQRVATQFQQAEAERQAVTGNPPSGGGSGGGQPAKKPKLEQPSDLKKRLAEHKAKRAEMLAGGSSGEATPVGAGQPAPTPTPTPAGYSQTPPAAAPASQYPYPQPYGGAAAPPFQQTASPGYQAFSPASGKQTPVAAPYPPSGYSPQPFPAGVSGQPPAPGYGATPPPFPQQQPTPTDANLPSRPGSLPSASGLPQRPAFGAPPVNAQQMQQMHMGHPIPPTPTTAGHANGDTSKETGQVSSSVDDLISGAAKDAAAKGPEPSEKPAKKEKSKLMRMIFSDETTSPEEKMAQLPRYAFVPDRTAPTALGELPGAVVVGTIRESDTVVDPTH
ncbi:hypothetical protein NUU61_009231 [Penicillium alfredii]|uniref:C2H2-type domain-containing protein n=1 Tax=Penicillium alfredii TaxID=1506179 RepID=A0A9W9EMR1_9EURO|nr:uncharacterized protein NUU61_009231 [Penicillium alfredii]KAJ5084652.1 hypothetical protein NUU61_009231 [Penicillium alfredii]